MKTEYEVIVVGAGPVGLLLSIELARRGIDVVLLEKLPKPVLGSKGKGIQPRSQELLDQVGVLPQLLVGGGHYPTFRIYQAQGVREEPYAVPVASTPDRPYPNILMVPQWTTERVLREKAADLRVPLRSGCEVVHFAQNASWVDVTVRDAQGTHALRARYVVGADGAHSAIRQGAEIGFSGQTVPRRAIFADVRVDNLATDVWHRWPDAPGGQVSLCPLVGTNLFQMAAEVPAEGDVDISSAAVRAILHERVGDVGLKVVGCTWSSLFRVSLRLADRYRVGRVFLAGDSAHVHPPTGGQGLNTGLQDAFNLGWKLATVLRGGPSTLLDTYDAERRPIAQEMLELAGALFGAWQDRRKTERGALTSQLELNYRDSKLSAEAVARDAGVLRAGDRAPDARLTLASGHSARLFELLRHPGFTLLAYGVAASTFASLGPLPAVRSYRVAPHGRAGDFDVSDSESDLQRAYGLEPGTLVLVRPDGYVGALATEAERAALPSYMQRWTVDDRSNDVSESAAAAP